MTPVNLWSCLSACQSRLKANATVSGWRSDVIISDVGDYVEQAPTLKAPWICVKDGGATVESRDTCGNVWTVRVRVWVIAESSTHDTSRGVQLAIDYRGNIIAALADHNWGVTGVIGRWHCVAQPETTKPFMDQLNNERLPYVMAEATFEALLRESRD